jgi:hypothetical protein
MAVSAYSHLWQFFSIAPRHTPVARPDFKYKPCIYNHLHNRSPKMMSIQGEMTGSLIAIFPLLLSCCRWR